MRPAELISLLLVLFFIGSCNSDSRDDTLTDSTSFFIENDDPGMYIALIVDDSVIQPIGNLVHFESDHTALIGLSQFRKIRPKAWILVEGDTACGRVCYSGLGAYENPTQGTYIRYELFYLGKDESECVQYHTDSAFHEYVDHRWQKFDDSINLVWEKTGKRSPKF